MPDSTKIKIGMILDNEFPPDDRPEKEAISLIEAGFEVYLFCYTTQKKSLSENYKGIQVKRFNLKEKIHKKLSAAYLVLPFYKMIWRKQMDNFIRLNHIDIIHVHDLPMTDIAHDLAKKYNCKVVCDQHEYWSSWIGNTAHYNTSIGKIVKYFSNWKKYERENLQKADLVITVEEPLRSLYISEVGIDSKKVITVPNTPTKGIFYNPDIDEQIISKYKDNFVIFYAGVLDVLRGIDLVIKALPYLETHIPNIKFLMAGRFAKNCDPIQMAKDKQVEHLVEFVGWLNVELLPSYIKASKLCVFTPTDAASQEINNTIATKIYQYVAMKKPIITSDVHLMKEYVEKNDIGISIKQGDVNDFVNKVLFIYKNYDSYYKNVKKRSEELINSGAIFWDYTVLTMLNRYKNLRKIEKK